MLLARRLSGLWEVIAINRYKCIYSPFIWIITYLFMPFMRLHPTDPIYESGKRRKLSFITKMLLKV